MMAQSRSSKKWLNRQNKDPYVREAKAFGYRSRAAFKLIEIQEKYQIVKPGMRVLELGAAPGSWTELLVEWVGENGQVFAVDLLEMAPIHGVTTRQDDIESDACFSWYQEIASNGIDLVVSDMAPNMCGHQRTDQLRSSRLVEVAYDISQNYLSEGGFFLAKSFNGVGFNEMLKALRSTFKRVKVIKPDASRRESGEIYFLGIDKKPQDTVKGESLHE